MIGFMYHCKFWMLDINAAYENIEVTANFVIGEGLYTGMVGAWARQRRHGRRDLVWQKTRLRNCIARIL